MNMVLKYIKVLIINQYNNIVIKYQINFKNWQINLFIMINLYVQQILNINNKFNIIGIY